MAKRRLIAGTINRYPDEDGWVNVHLDASDRLLHKLPGAKTRRVDIVADIAELGGRIEDDTFDEIRCWETLEHLRRDRALLALDGFFRILKRGGKVDITVPDLESLARRFVAGDITFDQFALNVYGDQAPFQDDHLMTHRFGWNGETLTRAMADAGFFNIHQIDDRWIGVKP